MKTELLIGCGNSRDRKIRLPTQGPEWNNLTTLDYSPDCNPDVVHDLEVLPFPFGDNTFDEIHAYEVLEHTGNQGDWRFFFDQFSELHRILKPDGLLLATVPRHDSVWAWGDPSHRRVILKESLIFLDQDSYAQIGKTAMTDFRSYWKKSFKVLNAQHHGEHTLAFILQAKKNDLSGHGDNNMEHGESV